MHSFGTHGMWPPGGDVALNIVCVRVFVRIYVHMYGISSKLIWRRCLILTPDVPGIYSCAQMSLKLVPTGIEG